MRRTEPPVVAIVGIDGAGKTTALSLVGDRVPTSVTLSSMRNHGIADAPLRDLSEVLERLRTEAEALNSPRLVLTAIFLQMCMFGPTERFFSATMSPDVVLVDRHPVVDAAVYLPVFRKIIDSDESLNSVPPLRDVLGSTDEQLVVRWLESRGRQLGETWNIDDLSGSLLSLTSLPDSVRLEKLEVMLQTSLPQLVVWLDLAVDRASNRLASRAGIREIHESRHHLAEIRGSYRRVLRNLPPTVQVVPIAVGEMTPDDVADSIVSVMTEKERHVLAGISAA